MNVGELDYDEMGMALSYALFAVGSNDVYSPYGSSISSPQTLKSKRSVQIMVPTHEHYDIPEEDAPEYDESDIAAFNAFEKAKSAAFNFDGVYSSDEEENYHDLGENYNIPNEDAPEYSEAEKNRFEEFQRKESAFVNFGGVYEDHDEQSGGIEGQNYIIPNEDVPSMSASDKKRFENFQKGKSAQVEGFDDVYGLEEEQDEASNEKKEGEGEEEIEGSDPVAVADSNGVPDIAASPPVEPKVPVDPVPLPAVITSPPSQAVDGSLAEKERDGDAEEPTSTIDSTVAPPPTAAVAAAVADVEVPVLVAAQEVAADTNDTTADATSPTVVPTAGISADNTAGAEKASQAASVQVEEQQEHPAQVGEETAAQTPKEELQVPGGGRGPMVKKKSMAVFMDKADAANLSHVATVHVEANVHDAKPITEQDLKDLIIGPLKAIESNEEKLASLSKWKEPYLFASSDLLTICVEVTVSVKTRLEIINSLGPRLTDPKAKTKEILELFRFNEDKMAAEEVLRTRAHTLSATAMQQHDNLYPEDASAGGGGGGGRGGGGIGIGGSPGGPGSDPRRRSLLALGGGGGAGRGGRRHSSGASPKPHSAATAGPDGSSPGSRPISATALAAGTAEGVGGDGGGGGGGGRRGSAGSILGGVVPPPGSGNPAFNVPEALPPRAPSPATSRGSSPSNSGKFLSPSPNSSGKFPSPSAGRISINAAATAAGEAAIEELEVGGNDGNDGSDGKKKDEGEGGGEGAAEELNEIVVVASPGASSSLKAADLLTVAMPTISEGKDGEEESLTPVSLTPVGSYNVVSEAAVAATAAPFVPPVPPSDASAGSSDTATNTNAPGNES